MEGELLPAEAGAACAWPLVMTTPPAAGCVVLLWLFVVSVLTAHHAPGWGKHHLRFGIELALCVAMFVGGCVMADACLTRNPFAVAGFSLYVVILVIAASGHRGHLEYA